MRGVRGAAVLDVGGVRVIDLDGGVVVTGRGTASFLRAPGLEPDLTTLAEPRLTGAGFQSVDFEGGLAFDWRSQRLVFTGRSLLAADREFPLEGPVLALTYSGGALREVLQRGPAGGWVPYAPAAPASEPPPDR